MDPDRAGRRSNLATSEAWVAYYEAAARRRGGPGDMDHRRLQRIRKRRRKMERIGVVACLVGVLGFAWFLSVLLTAP